MSGKKNLVDGSIAISIATNGDSTGSKVTFWNGQLCHVAISPGLSDPNKHAWEQMTEGWIRTKCSEMESLLCSTCRRISGDFCTFLVSRCKFGDQGQCPVWKRWTSEVLQRRAGRAGAVGSAARQAEQRTGGSGSLLQTCCGGGVGHQSILLNPLLPVLAEGRAEFLEFIGQELEAVKMNSREKAVCKTLRLEVGLFVFFLVSIISL